MSPQPLHATPQVAELLMKFQCSGCAQVLSVGVERLTHAATDCPRCHHPIEIPALDRHVGGVETILQANPETVPLTCPGCSRTSKVPLRFALKKLACPACGQACKFHFVPVVENEDAATDAPHHKKPSSAPPPLPNDTAEIDAPDNSTVEGIPVPEVVVYGSTPHRHTSPSLFREFLTSVSPRTLTWIIWFFLQFPFAMFILVPLANFSQNIVIIVLALAWLIPKWGLASYATDLVLVLWLKSIRCPHCHEDFETVSRWGCACGYNDHKERHLYGFRCPKCRRVLGYYNCVRCDATIILR